eukprot:4959354-Karenia_brevis.AAC.1
MHRLTSLWGPKWPLSLCMATIIKDDKASNQDGRVAMMVDRSGEEICIKVENLSVIAPPLFGGVPGF